MANVPLKSITFPGLPDTYQIPQIDTTLTTAGKAADAKVTGGKLNEMDTRVNALHSLVNYGYDVPYEGTASGGSGDAAYSFTVARLGTTLKLNGTVGSYSGALRMCLSGVNEVKVGASAGSLTASALTLVDGHTYRVRQHVLSGSATSGISPGWALTTGASRITDAPETDTNGDVYSDLVYNASSYSDGVRLLLFISRNAGNTLSNWTAIFTLEDLTASASEALAKRVLALEAKLDYLELTDQIDLSEMEG